MQVNPLRLTKVSVRAVRTANQVTVNSASLIGLPRSFQGHDKLQKYLSVFNIVSDDLRV